MTGRSEHSRYYLYILPQLILLFAANSVHYLRRVVVSSHPSSRLPAPGRGASWAARGRAWWGGAAGAGQLRAGRGRGRAHHGMELPRVFSPW